MFTGIIIQTGEVKSVEKGTKSTKFVVSADKAIEGKKEGESIAVNGACMTIIEIGKNNKETTFTFEAMPETLEVTNLGEIKEGSKVNLEPALTMNQAIDGHMVQGHVDCMGEVVRMDTATERSVLTVKFPKEIAKYLAHKGSVTLNGVSLTISLLAANSLNVDLIPHTLTLTNLGELKPGDKVNIEVDMMARYIERLLDDKNDEAKYFFLQERNLI